ncbi:WhiB family transcriptional regulator [Streptomyces sp. G1]|uniref:WhiB family transcriptional regulator n=1 Tax=Streptomyces sp. G1 TaxID=361572 RepID=UPI00202FC22B|nr:WhiB family transcriptional regulator [Streptomyces sp. G1]MCM1972080.1 WhiB family transcriptional regulator [Streptomyces sp. G1]
MEHLIHRAAHYNPTDLTQASLRMIPVPALSTEWMTDANCQGADPDVFFGAMTAEARQLGGGILTRRAAIEFCEDCPVRRECLEYALEAGEE